MSHPSSPRRGSSRRHGAGPGRNSSTHHSAARRRDLQPSPDAVPSTPEFDDDSLVFSFIAKQEVFKSIIPFFERDNIPNADPEEMLPILGTLPAVMVRNKTHHLRMPS